MKLTSIETAHICRGLSLLLHGGLPLADGAMLLAPDGIGRTKAVLEQIGNAMLEGLPLSQAMEKTGCIPNYVSGMAAVGEETGRMEEALEALADFYEEREQTQRQLRTALTYPCMVVLLMLVVITVLLTSVLPMFDRVYASLGQELTGLARLLLDTGRGLKAAMPGVLILMGLVTVTALLVACWPRFREAGSRWFQSRFGDRGILRQYNNARFARALAMGLASALPLEEAMLMAGRMFSEDPGAAGRCQKCLRLLEAGEELSQAMAESDLLAPAHSKMLSIGLRCGSSDQVMANIARQLQADAQNTLENTISRIEPTLVLICSALVGGILLTVMLPLAGILAAIG